MALPDPYDGIKVDRALVIAFIGMVSRCEYAMKLSGFVAKNPKEPDPSTAEAHPSWDLLANAAKGWITFEPGTELDKAIQLLVNDPPEVQMQDGRWTKKPLGNANPVAGAVLSLKRVRNNLFHGGKSHKEREPGRDAKLVGAAFVLLQAVIEQSNNDLRWFYEER